MSIFNIQCMCGSDKWDVFCLTGIRPQDTPEGSCLSLGSGSIGAFLENLEVERIWRFVTWAVNSGTDG